MSGTDRDIVLSSRIRLARNIKGLKYFSSLSPMDKTLIEEKLLGEFTGNPVFQNFSIYKINDRDELDRVLLKEKKIISERYYRKGDGLVITDNDQLISIVTGDLDHLRISAIMDGLSIDEVFNKTSAIEKELGKHFNFINNMEDNHIWSNNDNGGTMKCSIFLHLPVLCAAGLMEHLIINTIETQLEVTGFIGGGAHSLGGLYLISNKSGFYLNEEYLADLLNRTAYTFIEKEREARESLLNGSFPQLEDKIFRSYGILKYCRQISEQEAISSISMVKLGVSIGWLDGLVPDVLTNLLNSIGNGSLRSFAYKSNPDETDIMRLRAELIRKSLQINI